MVPGIASSFGSNVYLGYVGVFLSTVTFNHLFGKPYIPPNPSENFRSKISSYAPSSTIKVADDLYRQVHGRPPVTNLENFRWEDVPSPDNQPMLPEADLVDIEPAAELPELQPSTTPPASQFLDPSLGEFIVDGAWDGLRAILSGEGILSPSARTIVQDVGEIAFGFAALGFLFYMTSSESKTDYQHYEETIFVAPLESDLKKKSTDNPLWDLESALAKFTSEYEKNESMNIEKMES